MTQGGRLSFTVLGDSIAFGQGAARPADTAGARLAADLVAAGMPARLHVVAVPGAVSAGLAGQTRRALAHRPNVALVITGANDLSRLVPPQTAADHLGEAVQKLVGAGAEVVVAPAPDLSVVPWVPPALRQVVRASSELLREAQTRAALRAGARVADVNGETSAAFAGDVRLFSADRFHPSSAGYAVIAAALRPAVLAAADAALGRSA